MKTPILLLLSTFCAASTFAQDDSVSTSYRRLADAVAKNQSADNAQSFSGYLSAVAQFVGSAGSTITFQPRLYDIYRMSQKTAPAIDTDFVKRSFERNLQTSIGFTPNSKDLFAKPDKFQLGLTYAILNNKEIPLKDFKALASPYEKYGRFQHDLTTLVENYPASESERLFIIQCFNSQFFGGVPGSLNDTIRKRYGMSIETMLRLPQKLIDSLTKTLPRRPLCTINAIATYGFDRYWWSDFTVKGAYSSYLFGTKGSCVDPAMNFSAAYSFQDDTAKAAKNWGRGVLEMIAGINLGFPTFELKPGLSYTYVLSGIYTKEDRSKVAPKATVSIKIVAKLIASFAWSYDPSTKKSITTLKCQTSLE